MITTQTQFYISTSRGKYKVVFSVYFTERVKYCLVIYSIDTTDEKALFQCDADLISHRYRITVEIAEFFLNCYLYDPKKWAIGVRIANCFQITNVNNNLK